MALHRVALLAASLYATSTLASPAPQIIPPGPVSVPKQPSLAASKPAAVSSANPSTISLPIASPILATPIIATAFPIPATPIIASIPPKPTAVNSPIIDPFPPISGFSGPPPVITDIPTGIAISDLPASIPTSFPSVAPLSSVSVPPVASGVVSSVLSAAPSVTAIPGLPSSLPIPSLNIDAVSLINQLSQSLQVLELIIGLLQTLSKTGEVVIPGIGPVGYAVEGVLINSLLKLVKGLIPTPTT